MRRVATVVGSALIVVAGVTGSASAVTPARTGWWERAVGSVLPVPPPAPVPDGGMRVGSSIDGTSAVAALRYELVRENLARTLTLSVVAARGTPALVACRVTSTWAPARGGPMSDAPHAGCDTGAAAGAANADATTWTFDVSSFAGDGVLDVVLQPAPGGDLPLPFDVVFAAPDDAALSTATRPASGASSAPAPSADVIADIADIAANPLAPLLVPGSLATIAPPASATTPSTPAVALGGAKPAIVGGRHAKRPRALGVLVLAIGFALLAVSLRANPGRVAWALGGTRRAGVDDETIAGLDRWAKPRDGTPPAI